jgi:lipopolysaccharide export system permease protein
MIKHYILNKYLGKEFLKVVANITFGGFCLAFVFNLFEEINFFKDFDVGFKLPLFVSILFVPSLLYSMFPFIILLSGIWFFLKIKKTDEIIAIKGSGISNFSVILVPGFLSVILGIFLVVAFNPISSVLVKKYESIKGNYEKDQDYLAAVTVNGIWIKEKSLEKNFIIKSSHLDNQSLMNVTIYEFDKDNNFVKRIETNSANISSLTWILDVPKIYDEEGNIIISDVENYTYYSMYDIKKIKSLYSNLDTISFWSLKNEIELLEQRGYSTDEMKARMQRSFAFPLFLLSMILLSGVFTLGMNFKENNASYVFVSIFLSVLIFYFNDFSAALGKTGKLPIEVSVWMPVIIIFIFSSVGLIHANQK